MKRRAKLEVLSNTRGVQRYRYRLTGGNGRIIMTSEAFPTKGNAVRAAVRAMNAMREIGHITLA